MTLEEAARLAGGFRWAEIRLFEVLGGWVASTPEADIKLIFDRHSHHHAWRAAQWWDRLPVLAGVDREDLTKPPNPPTEQAYAGLSELESTPARLAAAYRFALPRLAAAYRNYQHAANPASDGSGLRTVRLVGSDLETDWRDGELALQRSLTGPGPVEEAARTVARLEQMVVQLP